MLSTTLTETRTNKRGAPGKVSQNKSSGSNTRGNKSVNEELDLIRADLRSFKKEFNAKINTSVNNNKDIPARDKKMIKEYTQQLLHPTRGVDIPRPIPSTNRKAHFSSQLLVDSDTDSIMFQIKPDPFNFIRQFSVRRSVLNGTGSLRRLAFEEAGDDDAVYVDNIGAIDEMFSYPWRVDLVDGTHIPAQSYRRNTASGVLANTFCIGWLGSDLEYDYVNGWQNVTVPAQTANITIGNVGPSTITVSVVFFTITENGALAPVAASSPSSVIVGQSQSAISVTLPLTSVSGTTLLGFGLKISNISVGNFRWEDIIMDPTTLHVNAETDHLYTKTYTLGQACYPNDNRKAGELDSLFSECQLYAPVACSTVLNVTQVLRDQGGNFLAAYLPTRTVLPPDPDDAWIVATTLGRSYPVATNHFAKGCHASWVGARIQDYEFRRPFTQAEWTDLNYQSLPSTFLIGQRAVSADVSTARYYLDFSVAFAVQTFDPKINMEFSPAFSSFMSLFLSLVTAQDLLVGENPDHLTRLKQLAIRVASDPRVHDMVRMGLAKAIPLLMSAVL